MFKKTINELKDLKEIEVKHDVVVKSDTENVKQVSKIVVKTIAAIAAIHVLTHAAEAIIDSASQPKKSND